ncbi:MULTISPECIES: hypothetical protein [unclassified Streptomyces]|uniref:hypothetical protein n=1 Tax=unclassified Streptomyces TaxID=2593676 RepID=UPI00362FAEA0
MANGDWSVWEDDGPAPGTALPADITATGVPWTPHRLYAVDRDGGARQRARGCRRTAEARAIGHRPPRFALRDADNGAVCGPVDGTAGEAIR